MSTDSTKKKAAKIPAVADSSQQAIKKSSIANEGVTWGVWAAILIAVFIFLAAQLIAIWLVSVYPALQHWSQSMAKDWLNNSVPGQFFFYLIAESLTVAGVLGFIRWRKGSLTAIGLKRPKLEDAPFAFVGLVIYLPLLFAVVLAVKAIIPGLNLTQQQAIGFSQSTTGWPLVLVFLSLVVMPPIAEEILFRGFVYSGLKRSLPKVWAVLLTCAVFAFPHLLESVGGGPLWVAGIDTFVLSLTLIWLREKTGRLYASMGLHGLKNLIAFLQLYPIIHFHL